MVVRTRKKSRRHRGSRTCGWGRMHRGAGDRGGVGNAGTGKRADCKKPTADRIAKYFGAHGFTPRGRTTKGQQTINVHEVEAHLELFTKKGFAKQAGDVIEVNLTQAGFDKLLGRGKVTKKLKITVAHASKGVQESIVKAGGTVTTA